MRRPAYCTRATPLPAPAHASPMHYHLAHPALIHVRLLLSCLLASLRQHDLEGCWQQVIEHRFGQQLDAAVLRFLNGCPASCCPLRPRPRCAHLCVRCLLPGTRLGGIAAAKGVFIHTQGLACMQRATLACMTCQGLKIKLHTERSLPVRRARGLAVIRRMRIVACLLLLVTGCTSPGLRRRPRSHHSACAGDVPPAARVVQSEGRKLLGARFPMPAATEGNQG